MNELTVIPGRDIETVTTEIRIITRQAQRMALTYAIEIGQRLLEAKSLVPHGEWSRYLRETVEFSQSTANNFIQLYKEYGNRQIDLFQPANSQALGNLPYTKALRLLALPAEEREEFLQENDVENMSTRELEKAIRERDEANAARAEAEKAAEVSDANAKAAEEKLRQLQESSALADAAAAERQKEVAELKTKLEAAKRAEKEAKDKVKALKNNPEIPDTIMKKMRAEAEEEAARKATAEIENKVAAAQKQAEAAIKAKDEAERKLEATAKAAKLANPDAAVFKTLFEQVQTDFNRLHGALLKVQAADPDTGDKLRVATVALLDKLRQEVSL